jgi:hypothetical protein
MLAVGGAPADACQANQAGNMFVESMLRQALRMGSQKAIRSDGNCAI